MAWDASRPVPWRRLTREWLVYVLIMTVIFTIFFRDDSFVGIIAGLLISGPLYLAFGYVLAKLGYQRRSYREVRSETRGRAAAGSGGGASAAAPPRPRPAPTKRTGGGSTRPGGRRR
jgi:hypothetical protein